MNSIHVERGKIGIIVVSALGDNLVYLVCRKGQAVLIDAGEAPPVIEVLTENQIALRHIFITHSHGDHTFAQKELQQEIISDDPSVVGLVETISAPGHTADGVMFYFPEAGALFTGDTLINGACGRASNMEALFESLQKIKELPPETLIFGGHDYLEENLQFGLQQKPDNDDIRNRLELYQQDPAAALFFSLEEELKTNVLLQASDLKTFTALRRAKDRF